MVSPYGLAGTVSPPQDVKFVIQPDGTLKVVEWPGGDPAASPLNHLQITVQWVQDDQVYQAVAVPAVG